MGQVNDMLKLTQARCDGQQSNRVGIWQWLKEKSGAMLHNARSIHFFLYLFLSVDSSHGR